MPLLMLRSGGIVSTAVHALPLHAWLQKYQVDAMRPGCFVEVAKPLGWADWLVEQFGLAVPCSLDGASGSRNEAEV